MYFTSGLISLYWSRTGNTDPVLSRRSHIPAAGGLLIARKEVWASVGRLSQEVFIVRIDEYQTCQYGAKLLRT